MLHEIFAVDYVCLKTLKNGCKLKIIIVGKARQLFAICPVVCLNV